MRDIDYEKATQAAIQGCSPRWIPLRCISLIAIKKLREDQDLAFFLRIGVTIVQHRDVFTSFRVEGTPAGRLGSLWKIAYSSGRPGRARLDQRAGFKKVRGGKGARHHQS